MDRDERADWRDGAWCDLMQALEDGRPVLPTRGRGYAVVASGDQSCILLGPDTAKALQEHGAPPVLVEWARATEAQFWPARAA